MQIGLFCHVNRPLLPCKYPSPPTPGGRPAVTHACAVCEAGHDQGREGHSNGHKRAYSWYPAPRARPGVLRPHTRPQSRMHARSPANARMCACTRACTRAHAGTRSHANRHMHMSVHVRMFARSQPLLSVSPPHSLSPARAHPHKKCHV